MPVFGHTHHGHGQTLTAYYTHTIWPYMVGVSVQFALNFQRQQGIERNFSTERWEDHMLVEIRPHVFLYEPFVSDMGSEFINQNENIFSWLLNQFNYSTRILLGLRRRRQFKYVHWIDCIISSQATTNTQILESHHDMWNDRGSNMCNTNRPHCLHVSSHAHRQSTPLLN